MMMTFGETEKVISQYDYEAIRNQTKRMRPISFGQSINVVLVTDRLYGCLKGFKEFFKKSNNITVNVISSVEEAERLSRRKPIDFVFIVGEFADEQKYNLIHKIRLISKYVCVILLANPNSEAESLAHKYEIGLFDRQAPLNSLLQYMQNFYDALTEQMKKEHPDVANRDLIWLSIVNDIVSAEYEETVKKLIAESRERPPVLKLRIL